MLATIKNVISMGDVNFFIFRHNIQTTTNQKIQATSKDLGRLTAVVRRGDKQQKLMVERLTADFKSVVEKYSRSQQVSYNF
jgi:t-SNARE domain-containing protein 1